MSDIVNNKTKKLKFLINSSQPFTGLDNVAVEVDRRNFLKEGSDQCAGPLSEYDVVLLDVQEHVTISENRKQQLLTHLNKGKPFVNILRKLKKNQSNSNYKPVQQLFTEIHFNAHEMGNTFTLTPSGKRSIFKNYLLTREPNYKISAQNNDRIISFANNTEENSICFQLTKYRNCIFIPWFLDNAKVLCEILVQIGKDALVNGEQIEEWVNEYNFGKLTEVSNEIEILNIEIDEKEKIRNQKIAIKRSYERIRDTLLYRDGSVLENVVKEVLRGLGIDAHLGKSGREDLVFILNNNHYLIEDKGCEKSANKENIKQIVSHVVEYTDEVDIVPKGILIINAWRKLPLEKRGTKDKPIFPNELMKLVNLSNIVLMTTHQLFVAYCDKLKGEFDLEGFIKKIDDTKSILEGYDDIEKYKVKPEVK